MTLTKQTVYLPVEITEEFWTKYDSGEERPEYEIIDTDNGERIDEWVNQQEGYFFTSEQLNAYTQNVIKQALETAAEDATITYVSQWSDDQCVNKRSILNAFEEIYQKIKV